MNGVDAVWVVGRMTISPLTKLFAPLRSYGSERIPMEGGVVLAMNHFSLARSSRLRHGLPADDPLPRQERDPQPLRSWPADPRLRCALGAPWRVRPRGGSRDARDRPRRKRARALRRGDAAEERPAGRGDARRGHGRAPGGRPGRSGRDLREPVLATRATSIRSRSPGASRCASRGIPRTGKGYREGSALIQEEIHRLWRWLGGLHENGRPDYATPPP